MSEFSGIVAIVTGSSSGIGERTAQRLAELGAHVVVNSASSVEAGQKVAESLPNGAIYVQADISDKAQCHALTDEIFEKTFNVNVMGTWQLTKMAMPHLLKSQDGNVVNITSVAGVRPMGSSIAYSMTKAALNQMTRLMAKSHGPVRHNAVAPGLVETPWTQDWATQHAGVAAIAPLKRSATPDDCAEAVLAFLRNKYVTGQIFVVDGGLTQVS